MKLLEQREIFWIAFNKPKAVITTMDDDKDKQRATIISLIPKAKELRLVPVGRLERDTTGLLLLTNDIGWIHPLTHNSFEKYRRYQIVTQGNPSDEDIELLRKGVSIGEDNTTNNKMYKFEKVNILDVDLKANVVLLDVVLIESAHMQLQRMIESIKCSIISIKRTEFGPIKLSTLKKGQWRELTKLEIDKLKSSCLEKNKGLRNAINHNEENNENENVNKIIKTNDKIFYKGDYLNKSEQRAGTGYAKRLAKSSSTSSAGASPSASSASSSSISSVSKGAAKNKKQS